uniref:FtsX-like permease family protein n=1 Tax=Candidatus Kentrum sp. DK TaxID=2126562 RepID=A0A450TI61_9GAMM|nr:MAG: FtsX-like permease family protein [Candidatus Kentron sp. DK]VFJ66880.1 MAG: FtsX-like permease family protein [Candidatus Kentron sp. DK]
MKDPLYPRTLARTVQRQRYLLDYALSSLLRHGGRHLALLVVYVLVVFLLASVMLFSSALRREAGIVLEGAPVIVVQKIVAGRHALIPAEYLSRMGHLRGVTVRYGRLWGYYYDPAIQANYTLLVPRDRVLKDDEIVIGAGIARVRGLDIGDYLGFRAADGAVVSLRVVDKLDSRSELLSADLILLSEARFRRLFAIPDDVYTDLVLEVPNPREERKVAEKVATRLPDTRLILREEILRTYDALFGWRQGIVLMVLSGAILAFAILAWNKASGLGAEEQREIGILKAIGWETGDVIRMKFWEGASISLAAFFIGYLLAWLHVFHTDFALFEPVLKGWSTLYPHFRLTPFVDGRQIATLFFFTVFPYTAATIIPVWRVAISGPDEVMR